MTGDRPLSAGVIAELGEHALIARIRDRAGTARPTSWIETGIGDDAAVLVPDRNERIVVTTDSLIEGVHFRRDWTPLESVGHKVIAVNVSDLAAMGARPRACLLSLALPQDLPVAEFDALISGVIATAAALAAPIVGGNLTRSPTGIGVTVTAIGSAHPRRILRRGGGRPGDLLFVSGEVGGAAAGLALLAAGRERASLGAIERQLVERLERPTARVRLGRLAAASRGVTACIDLSDGLGDGVTQLATASGLGAIVDVARVPVQQGASDPLAGGEDYELLFAVSRKRRRSFLAACSREAAVPVTQIGELTREPGIWAETGGRRTAVGVGFRHF
jgi:thiamine-monophosphate kinase